ncbi:SpoIIE family protein phosphatase [Pseudanabaena sp. ABRG5-3]|uniref:SpoIIE family protein phosphatase n=1 Tax=Pseudanabaena sp. ABRG5-3 TaxID=685565 RepID=UPI000DC6DB51|nr:SpoIIE family protein phosphatase [Pseudanabaena sp. ABRG5-3]BBC25664.1 protein serine/threonine phosphatase with Cache sensor [Pseudanabaena sp. ABRG5-3]
MSKPLKFQFKSITHRLIFSCVVSAIAIYGISYWHARQLLKSTLDNWVLGFAQSQVSDAAHEMDSKLLAIEKQALNLTRSLQDLTANFNPNSQNNLDPQLQIALDQLFAQPQVQAIALVDIPQNVTDTSTKGWQYSRQEQFRNLDQNLATNWLARCKSNSHANDQINSQVKHQAFWTKPHFLNNSSAQSITTYCIPLSQATNPATTKVLAISIDLDWLKALMNQKKSVKSDEISELEIGEPFAIAPLALPDQQWLVKPNNLELFKSLQSSQQALANRGINDSPSKRSLISINNSPNTIIAKTIDSTDWIVGIVISEEKLAKLQQKHLWLVIFSMSKDMVLMCVVIALISQLTTRPLRALNVSTEEMAKGNLDTTLPPVTSNDEVGQLTQSFRRMRDSLQLYIHDLQETTAAKQKLESELSIAAQIQRTMLPRTSTVNSVNSPYDISAVLKPARIVGGDLYDFFLLGSERLCLIIGDVADKGFPSALQMARTITLIRTLSKAFSSPTEILRTVNIELCKENEDCLFVTVFCGVLELQSGRFTYASGGHDAPILVRDRHVQYLDLETMPPLGLYEDSEFTQHEFMLLPNDLILFYTDGITEALNSEGELFSDTRLLEMITSYPPTNPTKAVRTIQHFCQQFVGNAPQSDDITLLAMQYLPSNPFAEVANVMEWNLTLNSEITELEELKQKLGQILHEAALPVELIENAQLIAEEIVVNIIQYGYDNRRDGAIDLRIEITDQKLTMTFADSGKPFNPLTEISTPNLDRDDDQRSLGGFGFFLVQELSDHLDYTYHSAKNILTVSQSICN